jgi:hypothetical protein
LGTKIEGFVEPVSVRILAWLRRLRHHLLAELIAGAGVGFGAACAFFPNFLDFIQERVRGFEEA